ncbi:MAG TPA: ATP-binding cassette domain-containing protein, partial [Candidatus Acidoferrales bacterium]|nr:ATP-binding cassette domain-containing protein [Candidatus Acidoferrales bacterium]
MSLEVAIEKKVAGFHLAVEFATDVAPLGLLGPSGSGKSMTLRAIANLLPAGVTVLSGAIEYRGEKLQSMSVKSRRLLAGPEIAMIFQEPMSAL